MNLPIASVVAIVAVAGLVRGVTGFGGAMFMAPPLSLLVGPVQAVLYALFLESIAVLAIIRSIWPRLNPRTLAFVGIPALLSAPVGGLLLTILDANIIRYLIATTVVIFSLLLMVGFRYDGPPRGTTSAILGGFSGVLFGATSMGGPPVILYLLSGPDHHDVTRANLVAYVSAVSAAALVLPWYGGALTAAVTLNALALAAPYLLGIWLGSHCFSFLSEKLFRRTVLGFMLLSGLVALLG